MVSALGLNKTCQLRSKSMRTWNGIAFPCSFFVYLFRLGDYSHSTYARFEIRFAPFHSFYALKNSPTTNVLIKIATILPTFQFFMNRPLYKTLYNACTTRCVKISFITTYFHKRLKHWYNSTLPPL